MATLGAVPAGLDLRLFGPMQVTVDGQPLARLRSRKSLTLIALLALRQGRPVERGWLAGTLWPDADPEQALASLRTVLSELRRAMGRQAERLQSPSRHSLCLALAGVDVDVTAFDAAIRSNKPSALEQAVALYRGPLLEGCTDEWVGQERGAREQDYLRALRTLATAAQAAGDFEGAAGYYRRAVGLDPWFEAAWRGLMESLAHSGDMNAALQAYREFVQILRSDPKAVPSEETTALYARLRAEASRKSDPKRSVSDGGPVAVASPTPTINGYLPHPLTDLIGREDERLEIAARLRRSRLVTLTGAGGVGKTRLAIEVAAEVVGGFADGVWLAALESISDKATLSRQIAALFGLGEEAGRTCLAIVADHLRAKRLLLVLDNCEHILQASAEVAGHLLRECAGIRILATSREALGITGETAWRVPSLATPDTEHLPLGQSTLVRVLLAYESVQLFVARVQSVRADFTLTQSNAAAVAQICARLDGIPLAIELAAARVRALTAEQVRTRLDDQLGLLTGGSRAALSRQQTLRATLDWSYDLLGPPERQLLGRLSVFSGGCDIEAVEEVCDGEGIEARQVLDLLTSLVDKSLIVYEEKPKEPSGRYRLLEMVRQYATEKIHDSHDAERVKTRHLNWCVSLVESANPHLVAADQAIWLERLETEYDNMRAALGWSGENERSAELGLRLAAALWRFWYVRGYYQEARHYLETAIDRAGRHDATVVMAKALNGVGIIAYSQSDFPAARVYLTEALEIRRQLADKRGIARTLVALGNVLRMLGEVSSAQSLYEESLRLSHEIGDTNSAAWTAFNLAGLAHEQGEVETANASYHESRRLFQALGETGGVAWSILGLAELPAYRGDYFQARELNEECHRFFTELGDKQGIAWSVHNLGDMFYQQRLLDSAQSTFEEALRLLTDLGDRRGIALSLNGLGRLACERGEFASAHALHEEALRLSKELGEQQSIACSLLCLGITAGSQGGHEKARTYLEESLGTARAFGNQIGVAEALLHLANLRLRLDDYADARAQFAASLDLLRRLDHKTLIAECLRGLAALMLAQNEPRNSVLLCGALFALRESIIPQILPDESEKDDRLARQGRAALGEDAFAAAFAEGRALTWQQAVALEEA